MFQAYRKVIQILTGGFLSRMSGSRCWKDSRGQSRQKSLPMEMTVQWEKIDNASQWVKFTVGEIVTWLWREIRVKWDYVQKHQFFTTQLS